MFVKFTGNTPFRPCPKSEPKVKEKAKPIKKLSVKRGKQNKEYLALRKVYLENKPLCEVKMKGCTKVSTEIHHAEKRTGFRLTNVANFVAICRNCHLIVEKENVKI